MIKANATFTTALKTYIETKALLDNLEKTVKANKKIIEDVLVMTGEMKTVYTTEDSEVFQLSLSEIERTDVNRKLLQERYPAVFADVKSVSSYNRLNVTAKTEAVADIQSAHIEVKAVGKISKIELRQTA